MKRWAWLLVVPLLLIGGVVVKRGPFNRAAVPGMTGTSGNDQTLQTIYALRQFVAPGPFLGQMWVDPYTGSDTNSGTYALPLKSFAKIRDQCITKPHMRCTVKGRNRVFSPLTFVVDGVAAGDQLVRGETVTWAAGASTGTVLDWDGSTNTLVIQRTTGTDPDCCAVTFIGTQSAVQVTDVSRADTLAGNPAERVVTWTDAGDLVNIAGHYYVNNQGPMRLYNAAGGALNGLSEGTDYYICTVIAGVSFRKSVV